MQQTSLSPLGPLQHQCSLQKKAEAGKSSLCPRFLQSSLQVSAMHGALQAGKKERCAPALQSSLVRRDHLAAWQRQVPHCCTDSVSQGFSTTCLGCVCSMRSGCGSSLRRLSPLSCCISSPCCWLPVSSLHWRKAVGF